MLKEAFYWKPILLADRDTVETDSNAILHDADTQDIAFLVVGDPFGATTRTDIVLRARAKHIPVRIIRNTSIANAVGISGLQLYSFGQAVSLGFFTDTTPMDKEARARRLSPTARQPLFVVLRCGGIVIVKLWGMLTSYITERLLGCGMGFQTFRGVAYLVGHT